MGRRCPESFKVKYVSEVAAMADATYWGKFSTSANGKTPTYAYKCGTCKQWHLTSSKERR